MCRSDTSETKTLQKRAFPCAAVGTYSPLRFLHALQKASTHLFPTPSPPLSPLLQFVLIFCLSPILNIVSHLSPPPRSFAVSHLHIKYLLFVLLGSAVGIGYIVRHKLNNSALSGLPKAFLLLYVFPILYTNIQTTPPLQPKRGRCYYHISFRKLLLLRQQLPLRPLHNNLRRSSRHIRE